VTFFLFSYYFKTLAPTNLSPILPFLSGMLLPGNQCFKKQIDLLKPSPYKRQGVMLLNINNFKKIDIQISTTKKQVMGRRREHFIF
jgi:hypothetical protein